ncbi:40S ribosomal protein S2-3 [Cocos nucifera]|uniref:Small ribosomal subunit protein uS5 n=1 Tax=Cocos nucifera TaxID=13894 RepID=A0A8K0I8S1_COCNU|nr:40S ribosomal protein S2-3 [Cocos nucifera]
MAERGGDRGGFGRGFGRGRGDRGRGRGDRRGGRRGGRRDEEEKWVPVTKLGRLVKEGRIQSLEEIYLHSLPVKEHQIVDTLLGPQLKDEVMKIMPVQKQTRAGQRTRFKAFVVVGDGNGHVGLGVKCSKEVATAIRGSIILAKLSIIPVRRGYWGNKIGKPHTVPCKVTGKCGSVTVRMVPAPRGAGIVAARVPKKVLQFAGIEDVFTSSRGSTKTLGNFVKVIDLFNPFNKWVGTGRVGSGYNPLARDLNPGALKFHSSDASSSPASFQQWLVGAVGLVKATFECLMKTYGFLTPDFWRETRFTKSPFQEYTDLLSKPTKAIVLEDTERVEA